MQYVKKGNKAVRGDDMMSMSKRDLRLVMMVPYVPVLKNSQLAKEKVHF